MILKCGAATAPLHYVKVTGGGRVDRHLHHRTKERPEPEPLRLSSGRGLQRFSTGGVAKSATARDGRGESGGFGAFGKAVGVNVGESDGFKDGFTDGAVLVETVSVFVAFNVESRERALSPTVETVGTGDRTSAGSSKGCDCLTLACFAGAEGHFCFEGFEIIVLRVEVFFRDRAIENVQISLIAGAGRKKGGPLRRISACGP